MLVKRSIAVDLINDDDQIALWRRANEHVDRISIRAYGAGDLAVVGGQACPPFLAA